MILRSFFAAATLVMAAIPGCAPSLPTQTWIDYDHALLFVSQRMNSVKTLTANCVMVLKEPSRGSITFEGALAIQPPGHLRIQCWKFTTKILDLTLNPDGLWIDMKSRSVSDGDDQLAGFEPERMAEAWMLFIGEMLETQPVVIDDRGGSTFDVCIDHPELKRTVVYSIDRRTLTAQWCRIYGVDGVMQYSLRFKRYRLFNDIAWPTQLVGESPTGSFILNLYDVKINDSLEIGTFTPTRNSVQQN